MNTKVETKHAPAPFILMELGNKSSNQYDASAPHRHDYFELLFFKTGGGVHRIDFKEYPIEKNTVHFISPGQVHQLKRGKQCQGTVLAFSPGFYELQHNQTALLQNLPFFENQTDRPFMRLNKVIAARIQHILSAVSLEYRSKQPLKEKALLAQLTLLLIELRRYQPITEPPNSKENAAQLLVKKFGQLIDEHFCQTHTVTHYALQLNVSPSHLNDCCKTVAGKNAGALIQERIVLEAKRLLFNTDLTAKEIAYQLGYDDPAYFSRFFKKSEQVSPNTFRSYSRKKYQ